jgi:hypothetical protein
MRRKLQYLLGHILDVPQLGMQMKVMDASRASG